VARLTENSRLALAHEARDNGRVIELTEPQVWVLIGLFAASTFSMITIVTVSFTRTLNAAFGGLRAEVSGLEKGLRGEISGLDAGVRGEISGLRGEMNARFEAMDTKFSGKLEVLDRDIQALSRRVFGAE